MKDNKNWRITAYLISAVLSLLFIIPLLWMVVSSLKPEELIFKDINSINAFLFRQPTLFNYARVFVRVPFLKFIFNSVFYVTIIAVCTIGINSICGYAFAKLRFPGKKVLFTIIIALIIVPFECIILPLYLIMDKLDWVNSFPALIVPFIADCFYIFMFRQFFLGFPKELEEAAFIDGASTLKTFTSIVIPNSIPVLATVFILSFTSHWGDFMWPLIITTDESVRNIQVGIQYFFTIGYEPLKYGQIMAALTMTTVPIIILFMFFQRYYVQGITSTGIKG